MDDGRIIKDLLFCELAIGHRSTGRPMLRFADVCKWGIKLTDIDPNSRELIATDCSCWRHAVREGARRRGAASWRTRGNCGNRDSSTKPPASRPTLYATPAAGTAMRESDCCVTPDAALNKTSKLDMALPLSFQTDGYR